MPAKPLNQAFSGMPQMSAAFSGWKILVDLLVIRQEISAGFLINYEETINVRGTWQPFTDEQIELKPEGQRSWEWIDLHIEGATMIFATNDRVLKNGLRYKVMARKDYTLNNFSEYHLIRDYDDGLAPSPVPDAVVTYLGNVVTYLGEPVTYVGS